MPIAQLEELLRRAIAVVGEARLAQDRILKRDGKGGVRAAHAGSDLGVHVLRLRNGIQQPVRLSGAKLAPALQALLSGKETCLGAAGGNGCLVRTLLKSPALHYRGPSSRPCKKPSTGRSSIYLYSSYTAP